MKIIITKSFLKEYNKNLKKYFTLSLLVGQLQAKSHTFINLHDPFLKCKLTLNGVEFRWVVSYISHNRIIPLFFVLKKDKKYWENVSWQTQRINIEKKFLQALDDIRSWDFEVVNDI